VRQARKIQAHHVYYLPPELDSFELSLPHDRASPLQTRHRAIVRSCFSSSIALISPLHLQQTTFHLLSLKSSQAHFNCHIMEPENISITICGDGGCGNYLPQSTAFDPLMTPTGKSSLTLRLVRSQWTEVSLYCPR